MKSPPCRSRKAQRAPPTASTQEQCAEPLTWHSVSQLLTITPHPTGEKRGPHTQRTCSASRSPCVTTRWFQSSSLEPQSRPPPTRRPDLLSIWPFTHVDLHLLDLRTSQAHVCAWPRAALSGDVTPCGPTQQCKRTFLGTSHTVSVSGTALTKSTHPGFQQEPFSPSQLWRQGVGKVGSWRAQGRDLPRLCPAPGGSQQCSAFHGCLFSPCLAGHVTLCLRVSACPVSSTHRHQPLVQGSPSSSMTSSSF